MKNILKFTLLSFTATLISSCAIVNFVPYSGKQQNWPTASGGFVQTHNEFKIYRGFPERPYTILGELIIEQYPQYMNAEIASAGKKHKADAAIIVDSSTVNGGSMNFGGGGTTVYQGQSIINPGGYGTYTGTHTGIATTYSNPSYSSAITWNKTTVYLINYLSQ